MLEFLSEAWIDALDRAATERTEPVAGTGDQRLVVQQRVQDGPRGDVSYHLVIDHGGLRVRPGALDEPSVGFDTDYTTAVAVSTGAESAQTAFMEGRLRIGGDVNELLRSSDILIAIDDIFATVRAETTY